ncbi:MAG TPA: twin-arginine translocation signal domain-containing protein [Mycobacteriales bacterium]|nr:twin-arginine translocation signal domain-containing protein [Mycobacteriales bacterium]
MAEGRIDRRTVIKAGAVGAAWAVPTLLSVQPAMAQTSGPQGSAGVFVLPAGRTATFSNIRFTACDGLFAGYQFTGGPDVPLASKPCGCFDSTAPDVVVGPFAEPRTFRVYLRDIGDCGGASCDYTYYTDDATHAAVVETGPGTYDIGILDSFFCNCPPNVDCANQGEPSTIGNLSLTLTIA